MSHPVQPTSNNGRARAAIAASYRETPQTDDDNELAMANAIAMTEAEPW